MAPLCTSLHRSTPVFTVLFYLLSPRLCMAVKEASDQEVTYSQLKVLLSEHDVQLFDVRTSEEYQAGHIEDAVNIPVNILEESLKMHPDQFEEKFDVRLPGRDDQNIVFYCKSGNRSLTAVNTARQLGFSRARHYKGGYSEWSRLEEK